LGCIETNIYYAGFLAAYARAGFWVYYWARGGIFGKNSNPYFIGLVSVFRLQSLILSGVQKEQKTAFLSKFRGFGKKMGVFRGGSAYEALFCVAS